MIKAIDSEVIFKPLKYTMQTLYTNNVKDGHSNK